MRTLTPILAALFLIPSLSGCVRRAVLPPVGAPQQLEAPPPGMTEVNVISDDEDQVWDVYAGDQLVCTTPCTQWFRERQNLFLKSRDGDRLFVQKVGVQARDARRALLVAEGSCDGEQVTGIALTAFGGMGVIAAISLTAIGCSDLPDRRGMCRAGLITGGVTVPLTAAAIWMIIDGAPKAHVIPIYAGHASKGQPLVKFAVGPTGIVGTF
jgi:hypothetical protein